MNSRQRRRIEAEAHNNRMTAIREIRSLRVAVYKKHGIWVNAGTSADMSELCKDIERLESLLNCDRPPKTGRNTKAAVAAMAMMEALTLIR